MINMQPIFYELNWSFSNYLNKSQPRLDAREHDNDHNLDSDLRLADNVYKLSTSHGPTMR